MKRTAAGGRAAVDGAASTVIRAAIRTVMQTPTAARTSADRVVKGQRTATTYIRSVPQRSRAAREAARTAAETRGAARDARRTAETAAREEKRTADETKRAAAVAEREASRAAEAAAHEAKRSADVAEREAKRAAEAAERQAKRLAAEHERQRVQRQADLEAAARRQQAHRKMVKRLIAKDRSRRSRRQRVLLLLVTSPIVLASGGAVSALYLDSIPAPAALNLAESTTVYFADGVTPMTTLGSENRTIVPYDDMNDAVRQAIVAAEDRTFWTNSGVDLSSVLRAAWNNMSGESRQGGSTITQQYARMAAGLTGISYARKTREAILAWKMDRTYTKEKILEFYLNTVPFGRGAFGVEAAARAFFGKTVVRGAPDAQQVTVAEAMVLASLVKQPEQDPTDPTGSPGYDPARGGVAAANAVMRWGYVRDGMVELGYLTPEIASTMEYPTVRGLDLAPSPDTPAGLVVNHVLSELRQRDPFADKAIDYIHNGGFRIVTTVDKRAQDAAEAAADIRRTTAPEAVQGQPDNWQAALVAVEPGTGRVLAYYGGSRGSGADFAGWYYDAEGKPNGYGQHPPGSSFKVYDLAEALRQGISLTSHWDAPATKAFPASGRTNAAPAGQVRNSSTAPCQPDCTLVEATVASLNVPFFDLTEHLGAANVIDMAARAGIDSMWTDRSPEPGPVRVDLHGRDSRELVATSSSDGRPFSTEVGIGQYGVTVLDHANGMATFAAGGQRAEAHFVRSVYKHDTLVYAEQLTQSSIGLSRGQVDELTAALQQVPSAQLADGYRAAGKTGTWETALGSSANAHTWMVGYTKSLAVAVWVGTSDGAELTTADGSTNVFGSTHAAPIWRQFLTDATGAMGLNAPGGATSIPAVTPTPKPSAAANG